MEVRSISFDTSFLLKDSYLVDQIIKILAKDNIPCFITSTVASELEQLKIWGRITKKEYRQAINRWKRVNAKIIDFKNKFLSSTIGRECISSMEKHHGVKKDDIVNDCSILVSALKNGIDIFLSEDYHFTSDVTKDVIDDITNTACSEYNQMCDSMIISVDSRIFIKAYNNKDFNIDYAKSHMKRIKKDTKYMGSSD
jgi:hypothetical protein